MDDKQRNAIEMFKTVRTYLNNNTAVSNGVPATVAAVGDLSTAVDGIDAAVATQESPTEGIAADKAQIREALEDQIMAVADPVAAFTAVEKNEELAAQVALTRSGLDTTSEQRLDDLAERVRSAAAANLAALGNYGIAQGDLDELQRLTTDFDNAKSRPRAAVAARAGQTETLPEAIRDARGILRDRIDKLMTRYRLSNATFYAGYQSARVMMDRRGPGAPDAAPLPA